MYFEINTAPSMLNTSNAKDGVFSQMNVLSKDEPSYDGMTIENMRGNPLFSKFDDIDKVGLAQNQLVKSANTLRSKRDSIRRFNDYAHKVNIPSKK